MPDAPARQVARVGCLTKGCGGFAALGGSLCESCQQEVRYRRSAAFCEERGLRTLQERKEFCRRQAREGLFRGASFETWALSMTQRTIDIIVLNGSASDEHCLERLRAAGVIDGGNKLIPLEARAVAAEAHRAERARVLCENQVELEARGVVEREPGQDDTEANAT